MTYLQILIRVAPLCLIFFTGVYFVTRKWIAEDSEIRRRLVRRIIQAKTRLEPLDRPMTYLDGPLRPRDLVSLPWQDRQRWNAWKERAS